MSNKVIVVAGPTASGKTALGIALALQYNGEIVSADSMQIYRRMDVGTAKATLEERALVPHHMLDVAEPWEDYSVSRYAQEAAGCCDDILHRGKIPVIVGGTGLYIDSLLSGRSFAETQEDKALREELNAEYDRIGGETMLEKLAAVDPDRALKLHATDKRRIVRALEIYRLTGTTITEHDRLTRALPPRYDAAKIVLGYKDRADLYARIDSRVDKMVEDGLFGEVAGLVLSGLSSDCTALQAIGYKELCAAFQAGTGSGSAVEQIKQNSRRYAKRQITWFGRYEDALRILWDKTPDFEKARLLSTEFLSRFGLS